MTMLSYVFNSATSYFSYLPDNDEEDDNFVPAHSRRISWAPANEPVMGAKRPQSLKEEHAIINQVNSEHDLYKILGLPRTADIDKITLRRAYLSRSKACHPDKFPDNPEATQAFQKVSVAYDVLSKPSSKRIYDARPPSADYDFFATRPYGHADQTFRSVVVGVFNEFLDGDLEMVRTLLKSVNDLNPGLRLGEDSIDAVLESLHSIRKRALTCRILVLALHTELSKLLDIQYAFRKLGYLEIRRRSRLSLELARVTLTLPIALETALQQERRRGQRHDRLDANGDADQGAVDEGALLLPRKLNRLIRAMAVVLERMENVLPQIDR
ncbi:DnaJ-domain-containing protein [Punctularia strigosozonata HHB-11173 SS5]|uniref:DnaJ-domain-containing protein n=1 Tax=Punctularia strigosozonata (strain HHB-11173) TaxID=741275 RepID=R7S415_PUNST|nr:DnaJ-domain-containing protein [Punctularia strigosozonata HHB-11173 SS5]EIN04958.1 DnaJ-domain-containing protein [Punctularia strigosozonata HHB-11173 SS5]